MGLATVLLSILSISLLSCSSFTMNHCRRSLHLLTGSFPSTPQSKSSYARYASSISNTYGVDNPVATEVEREVETVAMVPEDVRYDNVTEGLRQLNSSWEFGTFNHKSQPTLKDLEDFEAAKLKSATTLRTDTNWVNKLTDEEVERGIAELSKYCSKERLERFELVLSKRTSNIRMVYENPSNANNVWASLRTLDAYGIQYIDVIMQNFHSNWRREVMTSAMGTQKWLTLQEQPDAVECLIELKKQGYRILVSDIHESSKSVHDFDWAKQKTAVVMGNEEIGCSQTVKDLADDRFYIPMKGFVESLNLSAASAVLCAVLESKEALTPDLCEKEKKRVTLTWMSRTVAGSMAVLRQGAGLNVQGNLLYNRIGQYTTRP